MRTALVLCLFAAGPALANTTNDDLGLAFVDIPPGTFRMGSDDVGRDRWDETPAREVRITDGFAVSQTEVTAEQFRAFRPDFIGTPGYEPYAAGVSWHDAVAFCDWLTEQTGRPHRLPTEAEWEYACRAGTTTPYSSGMAAPAPGEPNPWGVANMHTGVREWCHDWYDAYPPGPHVDPVGPANGLTRVVRGGLLDDRGRIAERDVFNASACRASMAPAFGPYATSPYGDDEDEAQSSVGLIGTWYGDENLERPQKTDVMTRLDNNWINDIARGRAWSARWRGLLEGPHSGPVTLRLTASTGARLRLGGETVVDAWDDGGTHTVTVDMTKGRTLPIEIDYVRRGTRQTFLKITWSWPGTAEHTVDERWLSHTDRERGLAAADGGGRDLLPGFHAIGFRVVRGPMPTTRPHGAPVPLARRGVRPTLDLATIGPDPDVPYFRKRRMLPIPLDNSTGAEIDAVGLHPSFRGHNHSPALEVCPNGDLLYVTYTSYREYEPGVSFIATRLRHGCDEWDMPSRFLDFSTVNDHAPMLWTDHDNDAVYLYWGSPRLIGGYPFQWTVSHDNGATWAPIRFPRFEGDIGPHSRQPINTAVRDRDGVFYLASDGNGGRSVLWATSDNGATWRDTLGRTAGRHTTFALLGDGRSILGLGGKNTDVDGYMPASLSRDGGRTWEVAATPFPAQGTNQRPCLVRLGSGRLVFAADFQHFRGHRPEGVTQSGSFVAFSDDDGASWTTRPLPGAQPHESPQYHDGAPTLGYSAMRQAPNGMIHLVSTMNRPCLHFEFNEAWLNADAAAVVDAAEITRSRATRVDPVETYVVRDEKGTVRMRFDGGRADDGRFLLHGPVAWYAADGTAMREARYALGRRTDTETHWSADGVKREAWEHHEDGSRTWTQYWPNGRPRFRTTWRDFACDGEAEAWDEDGKPMARTVFVTGAGQAAERDR